MKKDVLNKTLVLVTIFLFFFVCTSPCITGTNFNDDTTPPITTHTLDPPEPDGDNGWYVSDVNVTLIAMDDISGVNNTYYRINSGMWQNYTEPFTINKDGDDILIEYYSIDNADNQETIKQTSIDMDQTVPFVDYSFEGADFDEESLIYLYTFNVTATDATSNINRVELFADGELYETIYGPGPTYTFQMLQDYDFSVNGFIFKRNITDEYIKFYAIVVSELWIGNNFYLLPSPYAYDNAGNYMYDQIPDCPPYPEKKMFKWYKFSNEYEGYIGNYYINAIFKKCPIAVSTVPNLLNFEPNNLFLRFLDQFPLLHKLLDSWRNNLV